ncbi:oxidoreductase [Panaeolus papilionaceus]|nr:oxidoreductase [Panaeolus papilionaceus]
MSPINVGFVGLSTSGWASFCLAPALLDPRLEGKYRLVAVSTSSPASAKATAELYSEETGNKVKAYHGSSRRIASDPNVDLVAVSVKAPLHKELALPAIEAGKDLFVEWPAGASLQETIEIAEAAKRKGVKTIVNLNARNSLVVRKIKSLIDSSAIGQIRSTTLVSCLLNDNIQANTWQQQAVGVRELGQWSPYTNSRPKYTVDKANGATALIVGIGHQLDAFMHMLGYFTSITASAAQLYPTSTVLDAAGKPTDEVLVANAPDQYTFSGILDTGAHATVLFRGGVRKVPGRKVLQWEIEGEEGMIRIESDQTPWMQLQNPDVYLNGEKVEIDEVQDCAPMVGTQLKSWEEYARDPEEGNYATVDDAVRLKRVLEAVEKSAEEGKRIEI